MSHRRVRTEPFFLKEPVTSLCHNSTRFLQLTEGRVLDWLKFAPSPLDATESFTPLSKIALDFSTFLAKVENETSSETLRLTSQTSSEYVQQIPCE